MRIKQLFLFQSLLSVMILNAQDISLALQKKPKGSPAEKLIMWQNMKNDVQVSFANTNTRYAQELVPSLTQQDDNRLVAWKGEKVHAQVLVWSKAGQQQVSVTASDLKGKNGSSIDRNAISAGFIGYVMTDEFRNGCGYRKPEQFDSSLVADPINTNLSAVDLVKNTVQPIWISVTVPPTTPAGEYTGTITVKTAKTFQLKLTVNVLHKTLPPP